MRSFFFCFFICWKSQRRYTRAWSVFQSVLCTVYLYKVPWSQTRETNEWSMSMILVTFLKFSFVWALKSAAKQLRLCIALSLSLAFQWPPLVFFFSLSHFKTTSVTVPELGVGETAVAASSGVSIVARRVGTGWMTHWKCCVFFCWTAMRRQLIYLLIYFFNLILLVFPELFQHIHSFALAPRAQTHTFSHMKRAREGEMLDQTDSFGLGKKDSSYL